MGEETIAQPLLSEETVALHCLPRGTTRLCPACLEEYEPYERLFWNLRAVLICPSHQIWLIDRCLSCQRCIPLLRSNVSRCPSCRQGDYRAVRHSSVSGDSILSYSQRLLFQKLGISHTEETPALYTQLSQLFEAQIRFSLHDRSQRQQWARKENSSLS